MLELRNRITGKLFHVGNKRQLITALVALNRGRVDFKVGAIIRVVIKDILQL